MKPLRLHKLMAQAGLASRRAAEQMILDGRVTVNGELVTSLGVCVDPARDKVLVDQRPLRLETTKSYLLFYKPKKCVTTLRDPQGRRTVAHFTAKLKLQQEKLSWKGNLPFRNPQRASSFFRMEAAAAGIARATRPLPLICRKRVSALCCSTC